MAKPFETQIPTLREARERGLVSQGDVLASVATFNQMMNRSSYNAINALVLTEIVYGSDEVLNLLTRIDPAILDELLMKYNPELATSIQIGSVQVLLPHHEILTEITSIFGCMNTYPTQFNVPKGQLNPSNYPRFSKDLKAYYPNTWKGFLKVITSDKDYLALMVSKQGPRPGVFVGGAPQRPHNMPTVLEMDSNRVFPARDISISEEEPLFEVPQKPQQTVFTMDDVKPKSRVVSEEDWEQMGPQVVSDESSEEEPEESPVEEPVPEPQHQPDSNMEAVFGQHLHERNLTMEEAQAFKDAIEGIKINIQQYYYGEYRNAIRDAVTIESFNVLENNGGILTDGPIAVKNDSDYIESELIDFANWIKKNWKAIKQTIEEYLEKKIDISKWSEIHRQFYLRYMKDQPF